MEEKIVTISMKLVNWNLVMHALAQRPYGEVAAVIAELQQQAAPQVGDAAPPAPETAQ